MQRITVNEVCGYSSSNPADLYPACGHHEVICDTPRFGTYLTIQKKQGEPHQTFDIAEVSLNGPWSGTVPTAPNCDGM